MVISLVVVPLCPQCARLLFPFLAAQSGAVGTPSGECETDVWSTWHTIFAKGAGTVEDHAALLCSLFLGFSMDAWVAIGQSQTTCLHGIPWRHHGETCRD